MALDSCSVPLRARRIARAAYPWLLAGIGAAALGCSLDRQDYYRGSLTAGGASGANDLSPDATEGTAASPHQASDASAGSPGSLEEEAGAYGTRELSVQVSGLTYTMLVARPQAVADDVPLPLVLTFHGDPDASLYTAESIRQALQLEEEAAGAAAAGAAAAGAALFAYPSARNGAWPYNSDAERSEGVALIQALLDATAAQLAFDRRRVFLVGWDGGAYFVSSMACRLPRDMIRGIAVHSGKLYHVSTASGGWDFDETAAGQTTCNFPSTLLIWGTAEPASEYELTRTYYRETLHCAAATSAWAPASPCVQYDSCNPGLIWCGIEGLGHSLWPSAGSAIWRFIDGLR